MHVGDGIVVVVGDVEDVVDVYVKKTNWKITRCAHTKLTSWVYFRPFSSEGRRAEGRGLAGYLSASCGHTDPNHWWDSNPRPRPLEPRRQTTRTTTANQANRHDPPVCRPLVSHNYSAILTIIRSADNCSSPPFYSSFGGRGLFSSHSNPDWTRGCRMTRGHLPIGWGVRVMLALRSLAGGNGPCPSLERSLDPK